MKDSKKKVVVIGGGITGLSAAYYLQKSILEQGLAIDVQLVEANHKLGGKIQTVYKDGFVIEKGPDSFLERKQSAAKLVRDVGLEDQLVNNTAGRAYVLVNDKLHSMPEGAVMGIPTKMAPLATTELFSVQGKMRAVGDLVLPRSKVTGDQSLGNFFRRRLGDEVVENLIEPLLSGIYAGDIDQLSLMSTFPQFYQVEREYRSLIRGMRKTTPEPSRNVKKGKFLTLTGGLQTLVDALEEKMIPGTILKGTKIVSIVDKKPDSSGYNIELNNGKSIEADSIVMALPHSALSELFSGQEFMCNFKKMSATTVATVAMAFDAEEVEDVLDGTGFVVSRNSDYTITACTWTHKKWPHTTPEGKVLLRCYVGRAGEETVVDLPDAEIEKIVLDDLKRTMNILATPEFTIVSRWQKAMPQYTVGHQERLTELKAKLQESMPGIFIAGSSFEGVGLPDCIDQGKTAVEEVLNFIK